MKREVLIAIITGFVIGLAITFGVYKAQQWYQDSLEDQSVDPTPTPQPQAMEVDTVGLEILEPEQFDFVETDQVELVGVAPANAFITVSTPSQDLLVQADEQGEFETTVDLDPNVNPIQVTSLTLDGQKQEQSITVTYLEPSEDTNQSETGTEE